MRIEIKNLSHTYGKDLPFETNAVKNVSLTIEAGEFVSLCGHTGSGKSTLVQHINGLLKPSEGSVLADGIDVNEKTDESRAVRHKIGLVFQYPEYQLFEETVLKDVCFGPKNLGCSEEEAQARAVDALKLVGLDPEVYGEKSPFDLSGGQKRRAAIAGVLAMDPEFLTLDEPTAGLDPQGHEQILSMIDNIRKNRKLTILMVSHDMSDIARLSDRVLVMNHGNLLMDGTPGEVFGRRSELEAIGLSVPPIRRFSEDLKAAGFGNLGTALDLDQAEAEILKVLKKN